MKLIQTKYYLLLIDEEAEIKEGDRYYCSELDSASQVGELLDEYKNRQKIIAYYPLTKEAKELDLPLLPPFEENIGKLIDKEASMYVDKYASYKHESYMYNECKRIFKAGYKAAQSKQFSLEDMHQCWIQATRKTLEPLTESGFTSFIQSLSTQQLPKEFIPGYEDRVALDGHTIVGKELKTITNSEGKEELVGEYKW